MSLQKNNYIEAKYDSESLSIGNFNTISGDVVIGRNVTIGNNCTIQGNITIGDGCVIGNSVSIVNTVTIGNNNQIFSGCQLGYPAQHIADHCIDNKHVEIGDNNIFRENCTIHLPYSKMMTVVENNCFFMVNTNIPHDALIHNNVVIAYNAAIGGHCEIFEFANIGLNATIHQNIKVGAYSMIGMGTEIKKNVLPFSVIYNKNSKIIKINKVGMERKYKGKLAIQDVERFFTDLSLNKKLHGMLDEDASLFNAIIENAAYGYYC